MFYRPKNKKICQRIWIFVIRENEGLDASKTASKKAAESKGKILGKKIANKVVKPKLMLDENSGNVEEIIIPPEKR